MRILFDPFSCVTLSSLKQSYNFFNAGQRNRPRRPKKTLSDSEIAKQTQKAPAVKDGALLDTPIEGSINIQNTRTNSRMDETAQSAEDQEQADSPSSNAVSLQ
jgi:hypothetical protein